jgi:hypothetical protein
MGVDMWFKDDVRNILLSVNASSAATAQWSDSPHIVAYRRGYQEALMAVALACGIQPADITIRFADLPTTAPPALPATGKCTFR